MAVVDKDTGERIEPFDKIPTKGRPKLILNAKGKRLIKNLAAIMCTDEEIASVLEVTVDTLTNKNNRSAFSECKKNGQNEGKYSLRRTQFELAKKNAGMAIFLGRQYLGQTDDPQLFEAMKRIDELERKLNE